MKKLFTITSVLTVVILIAFACKKSSTTTTPSSTSSTTGSTTSTTSSTSSTTGTTSTPTNTTTTNFTINGTSASNLHVNGSAAGSQYLLFVYNTVGTYPEIDIEFLGTTAPATGTYNITNSTPAANQCSFSLSPAAGVTAIANSGVVHVVAATSPNNTAYFTNIVCTATSGTTTTTYTVTGALKY